MVTNSIYSFLPPRAKSSSQSLPISQQNSEPWMKHSQRKGKENKMTRRRIVPVSLLLLLLLSSSLLQIPASPHPGRNSSFADDEDDTTILEGVLKEIGNRQKWSSPTDIRSLGVSKVRFGSSRRYEFRIRSGRKPRSADVVFQFPDQVDPDSWSKTAPAEPTRGLHSRLVGGVSPASASLDTFRIEGPFDLWARSDHRLFLSLPMNASHFGLKRVIVSRGIVVEVSKAREVSLSQSFYSDPPVGNGSLDPTHNGRVGGFCPFCPSSCPVLLPISVNGSALLVAYWAWNPDAVIRTAFLSNDTVELLPEKCYLNDRVRSRPQPVHSLSLTVARLERLLKGLSSDGFLENRFLGSVKVDLIASVVVRFVLEVERSIGKNESRRVRLAEWRTRPTVEHVSFEVVARVEAEKLKPLVIKKIMPFVVVDTASWSNLMSNISFTKFPSILVHPESLTLDVKW